MTFYIESLIQPPGLNILCILLGSLIWAKSRMVGNVLMLIGFLSLWLLSTPIVAYSLVNLLQKQFPILEMQLLKKVNKKALIVVLGGGSTLRPEYNYQPTISDFTMQRVNYAAYLHQKTHLAILVSGGKAHPDIESEAKLMSDYLQDHFKIQSQFLEDKSLNTAEESKYILPILQKNHIEQIYLVTNAWHMPRSVYIFQCAGIKVVPAPMGYYVYGPSYALISFLPNMDALYASSIAFHELFGLIWYKIHYGNTCA